MKKLFISQPMRGKTDEVTVDTSCLEDQMELPAEEQTETPKTKRTRK